MASILIATPIYRGHEEFLEGYLAAIDKQGIACDIVFANTDDVAFGERLALTNRNVLSIPHFSTKYERVIAARQAIIRYFLEGSWTHLFFVDADIYLRENTVELLVKRNVDIVSGVYLSPMDIDGKKFILPIAYDFGPTEEYRLPIAVITLLRKQQLRAVHSVGFGCCMLTRRVCTTVSLRPYQGGNSSEDIFFCIDARKNGFTVYLDPAVWVDHHAWPLHDKRNLFLTKEWNEKA